MVGAVPGRSGSQARSRFSSLPRQLARELRRSSTYGYLPTLASLRSTVSYRPTDCVQDTAQRTNGARTRDRFPSAALQTVLEVKTRSPSPAARLLHHEPNCTQNPKLQTAMDHRPPLSCCVCSARRLAVLGGLRIRREYVRYTCGLVDCLTTASTCARYHVWTQYARRCAVEDHGGSGPQSTPAGSAPPPCLCNCLPLSRDRVRLPPTTPPERAPTEQRTLATAGSTGAVTAMA